MQVLVYWTLLVNGYLSSEDFYYTCITHTSVHALVCLPTSTLQCASMDYVCLPLPALLDASIATFYYWDYYIIRYHLSRE